MNFIHTLYKRATPGWLLTATVVCAVITQAQTALFPDRGGIAMGLLLITLVAFFNTDHRINPVLSRAIGFSSTALLLLTLAAVVLINAAYPLP